MWLLSRRNGILGSSLEKNISLIEKKNLDNLISKKRVSSSILLKLQKGRRVTVPAEWTLASDYIRKKLSPKPEVTALMHAFSRVLNELTLLGEVKCY